MHKIKFPICLLSLWAMIGSVQAASPQLDKINLPPGFKISIYTDQTENSRSLALGDDGIVYVGTRRAGNVYAVRDADGDHRAEQVFTLAKGLNMPNGVAFRDGSLYVAEVNRILRYDNIAKNLENPPEPVVLNDDFPSDRHHGWKFIRFGPDNRLYVPVGAPCNVCKEKDPVYATITSIDLDGKNREIYAEGVRNTVGFDWHPQRKTLWFTDNGRDMLGDEIPPDELNHAPEKGMDFGFPYCHGDDLSDKKFGKIGKCEDAIAPAGKFRAHVAAVGMRFYTGKQFPEKYRNQIFVAQHGSWNRTEKIGYRVMLVTLDDNDKVTDIEDFANGWLNNGDAWGRPADVEVMPDGSLLISDDYADAIYRISYEQ
ncbi:MAG: sorbosone dehydrogenase family protein [Pseudomonadota bacterium]